MASPLVSVVIATYNSGDYLRAAIDSVLSQTIADLELLVIDDGSTDDTRALVASISDPRLTYIWQRNAGQTSAKNHGVRKARGEFIGFCDGDDYWYPNKLELQLPLFERDPRVAVVYSAADTIDEHGNPIEAEVAEAFRGDITHELFLRNFVPFGTSLVRRGCMEEVGGFDESLSMGIDWDLWLRISARYHFDYVPQATYAYRIWGGQMSKDWRGRYASAFRIMDNFLRRNPGVIPRDLKRRAFANTYSNKARARMHEHPLAAVRDALRGVVLDPAAIYSWKTACRTMLNAVQTRGTPSEFERRGDRLHIVKRSFAPLVRAATASQPRLFMYHRFGRKATERAFSANELREHALLLKSRFRAVTLSDVLAADTSKDRRPIVALTVDDGYEDFYRFAYPVLRELDIPATIFVTTGFIDGKLHLWPDEVHALLQHADAGTKELGGIWQGMRITLGSKQERERAWHQLADQLVYAPQPTRTQGIADLEKSLGLKISSLDMSPYAPMSWAQVRELHDAGFEIGDHTYSHPCLALLEGADLEREIQTSKALLEAKLGTPVRSFAYPNGTHRDYSPAVIDALKRAGYKQAVVAVPGDVSEQTRFELGRFSGLCSPERFSNLIDGYSTLRRTLSRREVATAPAYGPARISPPPPQTPN